MADFTKNDFKSYIHQGNVYKLQGQQSGGNESLEEEHKIDVGEFIIQSDSIKKEVDEEIIPFDENYQPKQVNVNTIMKEENVGLQNIKKESEEITCTNNSSTSSNHFCKFHL